MTVYLFILALRFIAQAPESHGQAASSQPEKLSCSTSPVDKSFGKRELWNGSEISVRPTAHFEEDSGADDACTAAIYDQSGKELYRTTGPGVRLDPATGMDIDGDGAPDVVLMNGASGGSGGSWEIEVISLIPKPHLLFEFETDFPPAPFQKDLHANVVLWSGEQGDDLATAYKWPRAARPAAQRVYRWIDGKLVDVTQDHCEEIEAGPYFQKLRRKLTPQNLEKFKGAKSLDDLEVDDMTTGGRVLSLILQHIFCRRFGQALDDIRQLWPEKDRANLIRNLKQVSNHWDCPECIEQISQWR